VATITTRTTGFAWAAEKVADMYTESHGRQNKPDDRETVRKKTALLVYDHRGNGER
jgi:hypothetical protein